ncbi:MAG: 50S ribosomal protein L20 [Candidatus Magnetoovum sp. WYHC-5]|nr:50S ribosomal protein L20 [Candidatus Magnetoovum sp. WYHC-5]
MPRAKGGFKTNRRRKRLLKKAKGYYGGRSRLFRVASEAVDHALKHAYAHRKTKKREFRALWIARINAAARSLELTYSQLINGLKKANILLNRKALAQLASEEPEAFAKMAAIAKEQLA